MITHKELLQELKYNPETGHFWWIRQGRFNGRDLTKPAGSLSNGRPEITVNKKRYYQHRLAYFYMTKQWPDQIDHINGDIADNKWANLRNCNVAENGQNLKIRKDNTSGYTGVKRSRNKWLASIMVEQNTIRLGRYQTPEEAHQAYCEAKKKYHTFNPIQRIYNEAI